MAFVIVVNSGLYCNSGGPSLPRNQKAIDTYPLFNYKPRGYIIRCFYPEFNHSNENYQNHLFLAKLRNLGLLI